MPTTTLPSEPSIARRAMSNVLSFRASMVVGAGAVAPVFTVEPAVADTVEIVTSNVAGTIVTDVTPINCPVGTFYSSNVDNINPVICVMFKEARVKRVVSGYGRITGITAGTNEDTGCGIGGEFFGNPAAGWAANSGNIGTAASNKLGALTAATPGGLIGTTAGGPIGAGCEMVFSTPGFITAAAGSVWTVGAATLNGQDTAATFSVDFVIEYLETVG